MGDDIGMFAHQSFGNRERLLVRSQGLGRVTELTLPPGDARERARQPPLIIGNVRMLADPAVETASPFAQGRPQ